MSSSSSSSSLAASSSSDEDSSSSDGASRITTISKSGNNLGHFLKISNDRRRKKRPRGSDDRQRISVGTRKQNRDYSDSDNSYEAIKDYMPKKARNVHWDDLADQPLSNDTLFKNLNDEKISELIGWATHSALNEECRPKALNANPLLGLPSTPMPPSHLKFFAKRCVSIPEFNQSLQSRFSDSALVATGMFLEEMITASLLPLAGYHVMRCRELENTLATSPESEESSDERISIPHPLGGTPIQPEQMKIQVTDRPSQEWTLPPEEAMLKLLEQNTFPIEGVAFHQSPTRSTTTNQSPTKSWQSTESWSREQGLSTQYIAQHMDIFRLFVPDSR